MFKKVRFSLLLILALTLPGLVAAHGVTHGNIVVTHAWMRAVVVPGMNGGGYLKISNGGAEADRLVAVRTAIAASVELHETVERDGMMHMDELPEGIPVPAGGEVALQPGGLHIMLMKVARKVDAGEQIPVILVFEKAGEIETHFAVQPLSGSETTHH